MDPATRGPMLPGMRPSNPPMLHSYVKQQVSEWMQAYRRNPNKAVKEASAIHGYAALASKNLRIMRAEDAFEATIKRLLLGAPKRRKVRS